MARIALVGSRPGVRTALDARRSAATRVGIAFAREILYHRVGEESAMPTMNQLVAIAIISGLCALVVTLVLHAIGLGEHAPIAAAVSASSSAIVAIGQMGGRRPGVEDAR